MAGQGQFHIKGDFSGGRTIEEFGRVMLQRVKYLGETSYQSIHAMAIDTLKSIRGVTKVAKPSSIKVKITPREDLVFSYYTEGLSAEDTKRRDYLRGKVGGYYADKLYHARRKMCIRNRQGFRFANKQIGRIHYSSKCRGVPCAAVKVFEFVDEYDGNTETHLICSPSSGDARREAKLIVFRRVARFAGLAKRAVSALMVKTHTKAPYDNVPPHVYAKAKEVTSARESLNRTPGGGGVYSLILEDNLKYAKSAIKGEQAAIDAALKRAANKSVGLINQRCKKILAFGDLKTPFPEIVRKKAA